LWFLFFDLIYAVEILDGIKIFDSFWARKKRDFVKKLMAEKDRCWLWKEGGQITVQCVSFLKIISLNVINFRIIKNYLLLILKINLNVYKLIQRLINNSKKCSLIG
jgi:hypothetical protein